MLEGGNEPETSATVSTELRYPHKERKAPVLFKRNVLGTVRHKNEPKAGKALNESEVDK